MTSVQRSANTPSASSSTNLLGVGSYTPFGRLVLYGAVGVVILIAAWSGALAGALFKVVWIDEPAWLISTTSVAIGSIAVIANSRARGPSRDRRGSGAGAGRPSLYRRRGDLRAKRPDPAPAVSGYDELLHLPVIAAAVARYAVVAFWVMKSSRVRTSQRRSLARGCCGAMRLTCPRRSVCWFGTRRSECDHMLGIDGQVLSGSRVDEPGELHDRTASRVDNRPFDVLDVPFDAVALSSHEGDLRRADGGAACPRSRSSDSGVLAQCIVGRQSHRRPSCRPTDGVRSAAEPTAFADAIGEPVSDRDV